MEEKHCDLIRNKIRCFSLGGAGRIKTMKYFFQNKWYPFRDSYRALLQHKLEAITSCKTKGGLLLTK